MGARLHSPVAIPEYTGLLFPLLFPPFASAEPMVRNVKAACSSGFHVAMMNFSLASMTVVEASETILSVQAPVRDLHSCPAIEWLKRRIPTHLSDRPFPSQPTVLCGSGWPKAALEILLSQSLHLCTISEVLNEDLPYPLVPSAQSWSFISNVPWVSRSLSISSIGISINMLEEGNRAVIFKLSPSRIE